MGDVTPDIPTVDPSFEVPSQPELWAAQHCPIPLGKLYVTGS